MAWMSQERKKLLQVEVDKVVPKDWKYSMRVRHGSTIVFTLRQAPVDLLQDLRDHGFELPAESMHVNLSRNTVQNYLSPESAKIMSGVFDALYSSGWYDKSDPMTDYFDTAWYVDVQIGEWDNPFLHVVKAPPKPKGYKWKVPKKPKGSGLGHLAKVYGSGQYKLSDKAKKKGVSLGAISHLLPSGWDQFTPGKKAAATKKAMKLAGFA